MKLTSSAGRGMPSSGLPAHGYEFGGRVVARRMDELDQGLRLLLVVSCGITEWTAWMNELEQKEDVLDVLVALMDSQLGNRMSGWRRWRWTTSQEVG